MRFTIRVSLFFLIMMMIVCPFGLRAQVEVEEEAGYIPPFQEVSSIDNLDIESLRMESSLWELLGQCTIRKELGSGIKADVAFMNPKTLALYRDEYSVELMSDDEMKKELHRIYDEYMLFFVTLKYDNEPDPLVMDKWEFSLTDDAKAVFEPVKIDATEPEITYGHSGNYYASTAFLYFQRFERKNKPAIDENVQEMSIIISGEKDDEAFTWSFGGEGIQTVKESRYFDNGLKIFLVCAVVIVIGVLVITRQRREWTESAG
jgi:hypothetical protein